MKTESLYAFALKMASEIGSLYRSSGHSRPNLLEFMDANEWFGMKYAMKDNAPQMDVKDLEKLRDSLMLWLSAYNRPGREKIDLMLEHFRNIYPETCRLYREFISDNGLSDKPVAWRLLDYLLSEIDREITDYNETDIETLINRMGTDATLSAATLFTEFLQAAELTEWEYSFNSRDNFEFINDAYSFHDFSVMAYCVFNEEMWEVQDLVPKATDSKAYADLWLFVALHFVCALRTSDMIRLPAPSAKQDPITIADELCIRIKLQSMKPSKTTAHEKVPELKLFIPESLKKPFGVIISIALSHRPGIKAGDRFITPSENLESIREFFGEDFAKAIGNRNFSSRRANKAYLQGIELAARNDNAPGKPKGYMLAALARSHKGGIASLPKATDIYLKDAHFSGYTPEFIIHQMFERGVFSFIAVTLLEMYVGSEFAALPIARQTELIRSIGFAAHQIERMVDTVDRSLIKGRKIANEILKDPAKTKENVFSMLQNIACGNAPSKQDEYLCLMTAAGFPCSFADRDGCIGCGYEIHTKTTMYTLMKEYVRIMRMKSSVDKQDAQRYEQILEQAILPAISEMLYSVKLLYPNADLSEMLNIVEKGLEHIDCDTRRNGGTLHSSGDNTGA